jgi:hypothetical protein
MVLVCSSFKDDSEVADIKSQLSTELLRKKFKEEFVTIDTSVYDKETRPSLPAIFSNDFSTHHTGCPTAPKNLRTASDGVALDNNSQYHLIQRMHRIPQEAPDQNRLQVPRLSRRDSRIKQEDILLGYMQDYKSNSNSQHYSNETAVSSRCVSPSEASIYTYQSENDCESNDVGKYRCEYPGCASPSNLKRFANRTSLR